MSSIKTCCCEHLWWKSISNLPDSDLEPLLFAGCYITMFHVFGVCMSFSFRFSFAAWVRKAITCKFVNPVGVAGASNPGGSTEKIGRVLQMQFYHPLLQTYRHLCMLWTSCWGGDKRLWSVAQRFYLQVPLKQNRICPFEHTEHFQHQTWQLSLFSFLA